MGNVGDTAGTGGSAMLKFAVFPFAPIWGQKHPISRMIMAKKPAKPARKSNAKAKSRKPARKSAACAARKRAKPVRKKSAPKKIARPKAKKRSPASEGEIDTARGKKKVVAKKPAPKIKGCEAAAQGESASGREAGARPAKPAAKPVAKPAPASQERRALPSQRPRRATSPLRAKSPPRSPASGRKTPVASKNGRHAEIAPRILTPADVEARKRRLKSLIVLGKDRGFLTFAEINDHLPDDVLDAEQIEGIISMIGDMGIQVYDVAPDAETLLLSDAAPTAPAEDVEEAAEAAVSTLDSEFGRTTDPVRMYMREMGSVELLTREGEIAIAKRIEEGLKHMIMAISACPMTVAQILELAGRIEKDELKIDDLVDGLMDFNEELDALEDADDEIEEEEDEGDAGAIAAENLERLKVAALARFATIRRLFARMLVVLTRMATRRRSTSSCRRRSRWS